MNFTDAHLPPLTTAELYVLFALARGENYAYPLKSQAWKDSLGSVNIPDSTLHGLLLRLQEEYLIQSVGNKPAGTTQKPRQYYAITETGLIRLTEELSRLKHLIEIAENIDVLQRTMPADIARMMTKLGSPDGLE